MDNEIDSFPIYKYYVEMYNPDKKEWVSEIRNYTSEQDPADFPDNKSRRNFKKIIANNEG